MLELGKIQYLKDRIYRYLERVQELSELAQLQKQQLVLHICQQDNRLLDILSKKAATTGGGQAEGPPLAEQLVAFLAQLPSHDVHSLNQMLNMSIKTNLLPAKSAETSQKTSPVSSNAQSNMSPDSSPSSVNLNYFFSDPNKFTSGMFSQVLQKLNSSGKDPLGPGNPDGADEVLEKENSENEEDRSDPNKYDPFSYLKDMYKVADENEEKMLLEMGQGSLTLNFFLKDQCYLYFKSAKLIARLYYMSDDAIFQTLDELEQQIWGLYCLGNAMQEGMSRPGTRQDIQPDSENSGALTPIHEVNERRSINFSKNQIEEDNDQRESVPSTQKKEKIKDFRKLTLKILDQN